MDIVDDCAFCMTPLLNGAKLSMINKPKCKHKFHRDCIHAYLKSGAREKNQYICPLCKIDFDETDLYDFKPPLPEAELHEFYNQYKEEYELLNEGKEFDCKAFLQEVKSFYTSRYNIIDQNIIHFCKAQTSDKAGGKKYKSKRSRKSKKTRKSKRSRKSKKTKRH